jgi:hypothetical protein
MGWTFIHDYKPASADSYFRGEFGERYTVLDSTTVNLTEYYAATRDNDSGDVSCFVAMIRWERNAFGYKDMDECMGPVIDNCPGRILDLLTPLPECSHEDQYCRFCRAEITGPVAGRWLSHAKPHQHAEVAGPRCYSGYPVSAEREDGAPFHEPGGMARCTVCYAREWRQRCRENVARRAERRRLLTDSSAVRLVDAERYALPPDLATDPTFTVVRTGRRLTFRHGFTHYRFSRSAQWQRAEQTGASS